MSVTMMQPIIDRLLPIPNDSGFRQDGYFVWCGSMIRVDGRYHLFASRWADGTAWTATRRERPDLFNDRDGVKGRGQPTHLITGVLYQGHARCVVQEIGGG